MKEPILLIAVFALLAFFAFAPASIVVPSKEVGSSVAFDWQGTGTVENRQLGRFDCPLAYSQQPVDFCTLSSSNSGTWTYVCRTDAGGQPVLCPFLPYKDIPAGTSTPTIYGGSSAGMMTATYWSDHYAGNGICENYPPYNETPGTADCPTELAASPSIPMAKPEVQKTEVQKMTVGDLLLLKIRQFFCSGLRVWC